MDGAFEHYWITAGPDVAGGFMDALGLAYAHVSKHPATGSPRYGHRLNIAGLRSWPLNRYPYLIFYLETHDEIDVIRVLHSAMDLPKWLNR